MAIASMERLNVSWATSLYTEKGSLITGQAGKRICIPTGPRADTVASRIIMRFESVFSFNNFESKQSSTTIFVYGFNVPERIPENQVLPCYFES